MMIPCHLSTFQSSFEDCNKAWPKLDNVFTTTYMRHDVTPCQLSWRDTMATFMYNFSSHFGELEHVFEVQIWIMDYIKCMENLVISNIYNGQMNPEQFQISAWHSCYSMLPIENKVQGEKRQWLSSCLQEGHISLPDPRGLREASVCKRLVIWLGPNWTIILPRHICAM